MIAKQHGLPAGLTPLPEGVTVHLACHARAQNMGPKAAEMLRLIPETPVDVIERCSGHGGTFGVLKETYRARDESGQARDARGGDPGARTYRVRLPARRQAYRAGRAELAAATGKTCPRAKRSIRSRFSRVPMD